MGWVSPASAVKFAEGFGPVVQLAYHAPDIDKAARYWAHQINAGPFYLFEHIKLKQSLYRGRSVAFDHSSAYGQLGEVMIELIRQHDDAPSAVRDMYDAKTAGLHHAAIFVDSVDDALEKAASKDMACVLDATLADGMRFVMVDARAAYGYMLEFYEPAPQLRKFYDFIRAKSQDWDGRDYLRRR